MLDDDYKLSVRAEKISCEKGKKNNNQKDLNKIDKGNSKKKKNCVIIH